MTSQRETILARIRGALHDLPPAERAAGWPVTRAYMLRDDMPAGARIQRFAERVAEYKASVQLLSEAELPATIAAELHTRGVRQLVVPADLPAHWLPDAVTTLCDHGQLSHAELDGCDGVVTGCALGIAQTGTIVLDHGPLQGRRAISLLPDYHLCIVWAHQIVGLVPEAIARLAATAQAGRPLSFISGPSATSDIELNRVEGVHGPRTLSVVIVTAPTEAGAAP